MIGSLIRKDYMNYQEIVLDFQEEYKKLCDRNKHLLKKINNMKYEERMEYNYNKEKIHLLEKILYERN